MEENVKEESGNGVYELGFLLVPEISEDKLAEAFGVIKDSIVAKGAFVISEEFPKHMVLAYTMEHLVNNKSERAKEGYFGWIKFELDPSLVQALDKEIMGRNEVIRHLLIKTVRENTIAAKRGMGVRRRTKEEGEAKVAPEMSKEEIDREIEALVDNTEAAV